VELAEQKIANVASLSERKEENMKPYAASLIDQETTDLFKKIEKIVQKLPEVKLEGFIFGEKTIISCHMLCRALAHFYPVNCKDGLFGGYMEHSWLSLKLEKFIIDPYPIACLGGPILIDNRFINVPWRSLYVETRIARLRGNLFKENTSRVIKAVGQTKERMGL
jgi:hypothetical protein